MLRIIKYTFSLLMLFTSSLAMAADYNVTLCRVQASGGNNIAYIYPCESWTSKNNCPNNGWIQWDASKFLGAAMYSTALAALTTGKTVTVRMDGVSCGGYDITTMLRIHK